MGKRGDKPAEPSTPPKKSDPVPAPSAKPAAGKAELAKAAAPAKAGAASAPASKGETGKSAPAPAPQATTAKPATASAPPAAASKSAASPTASPASAGAAKPPAAATAAKGSPAATAPKGGSGTAAASSSGASAAKGAAPSAGTAAAAKPQAALAAAAKPASAPPPDAKPGWNREFSAGPAPAFAAGSGSGAARPVEHPVLANESLKNQGDKLEPAPQATGGKATNGGSAGTAVPAPAARVSAPPAAAASMSSRPATQPAGQAPPTTGVSGISAAVADGARAAAPAAVPATLSETTKPAAAPAPAPAPAAPAAALSSPAARADAERAAVAEGKIPPPVPATPPAEVRGPTPETPLAELPGSSTPHPATRHVPTTGAHTPPASLIPIADRQPPMLFEIAWEVCWQLGGIYTVLRSKAQAMIDRWGDRYCLIGPYNPNTAAVEFEEQPTYGPIREAMNRLKDSGVPAYFGRWLIAGRPRVILIDYRARYGNLGTDKWLMWEDHKISLPPDDGEINEVVAFGFGVAEFFRHLTQIMTDRPILAHFHEWMGGVAVPRIAHMRLPVSTVFTTHATLLGRYLAGDNPYFYDHIQFIDPDKEAAKYMIYPRFAIERAAAHASTVFTTVSDVTGVEAEKLLGRTPDLIVPNGINLHRFAAPHEFQHLHAQYKEKINEFVMGHFFPSYTFDLDRTLYVFTSGRYEYRNKGMDMFIEAMNRLNWRLKGEKNPPTVVAFIITRAQTRNINVQVLQNQSMYEDLRNTCQEIQRSMGGRLLGCTARGQLPQFNDLLKEDEQVRLKRAIYAWRTHRQPLIVTHDLADDANDPVLMHLRHRHMFNAADDPVKMVFHPDFLKETNPVMGMDYDQFVRGTHMGIFPSYYEPWGYTPLECIALGVPAVTSDLAGFGSYVEKHVYPKERREADRQGMYIVHRRGKGFDEACDGLVNHLFQFCQLTRRQRIEMRNRTERLGEQFDWSTLAKHYDDAHNLALDRAGAPRQGQFEIRMV